MSEQVKRALKVFGGNIVATGVMGSISAAMPASTVKDQVAGAGMNVMNILAVGSTADLGLNMIKKLKK